MIAAIAATIAAIAAIHAAFFALRAMRLSSKLEARLSRSDCFDPLFEVLLSQAFALERATFPVEGILPCREVDLACAQIQTSNEFNITLPGIHRIT